MATLFTIEQANTALKIKDPTDEEAKIIKGLVDTVWAGIATYTGRELDGTTELTQKIDGSGRNRLSLREYPISSITTVTRTKEDASNTAVVVASSEYKVQQKAGQLVMHPINFVDSSIWIRGDENYSIVYKAGYTEATVPDEIRLAWEIWLSILFVKFTDRLHHISSASFNDEHITFEQNNIPPQVAELLKQHRRLF